MVPEPITRGGGDRREIRSVGPVVEDRSLRNRPVLTVVWGFPVELDGHGAVQEITQTSQIR